MEKGTIQNLQQMALATFDRVPQSEAAPWLQAALQAEIALQLQGINANLDYFTRCIDSTTLEEIAEKLSLIGSIILDK